MSIGSSSACRLHVCFRAPACPVALAKDGGAAGCCLPGCQPAFLGRSNAYCWSSQVGCSWSGASEDAPVSPIKTLHKVAGLLDSTHHLGPKSHFSVTGVFIRPSLVGGTDYLKRERKEMLAQSQEVELGPEKLPPTSLPRPFRSELLCPPHTIPASQPDVRVGWQASYLRAETSKGRL